MEYSQTDFTQLKPLQQKHTEVLSYIDSFCREHDIRWCLAYGSVLGAVRHGGPIPWDDDIDIHMPAADYEKFKTCFASCGDHDRYYLQELQSCDGMISMAKLRVNHTAYIEDVYQNFDMHQGIFADIFLLHDAPPNRAGRLVGNAAQLYLLLKELSNKNYGKRKAALILMKLLRLFPRQMCYERAFRQLYRWDGTNQKEFALWEYWRGARKKFMPREDIFPAVRVNYDGLMLPVPHAYTTYLERIYGDWKQLPDLKTIDWTQHCKVWSTTEDFRSYAPNIHSFSDEGRF